MRRGFFLATVIATLFGPLATATADPSGESFHGPHMWDGGGWMFVWPLMMILFVAAIAVTVVLLLRWLGRGQASSPGSRDRSSPVEILKDRFARGEIDKEEFEERRRVLGE